MVQAGNHTGNSPGARSRDRGDPGGAVPGRAWCVRGADGGGALDRAAQDRAEVEADWKLRRERGIDLTQRDFRNAYAMVTPEARRLLDFGGFSPDCAVLRWGNYDRTLVLPATVFQPDDHGRAYRLKPNTRSIWLRNFDLPLGLAGFFLMPDSPGLREAIVGTGARILPGSAQTTNSWGCRGSEPDVNAPVRGLILGDSNIQALFIGDDETPSECLRRELQAHLGKRVSVLNTGHLGYSLEQIYYTLLEYGDRFKPHFVVLSFCSNDFGSLTGPDPDRRDEEEGRYWLDRITMYCRAREIVEFDTPIPHEYLVTSSRSAGRYPGRVCDLLETGSLHYCNPVEAFVHEHLRLQVERVRSGKKALATSPLFNGAIGDAHMSALGATLWGKVLGTHLALLLEKERGNTSLLSRPH